MTSPCSYSTLCLQNDQHQIVSLSTLNPRAQWAKNCCDATYAEVFIIITIVLPIQEGIHQRERHSSNSGALHYIKVTFHNYLSFIADGPFYSLQYIVFKNGVFNCCVVRMKWHTRTGLLSPAVTPQPPSQWPCRPLSDPALHLSAGSL